MLILPVNLWYSEAMGIRALSLAVFGVVFWLALFLSLPTPSRGKGKKKRKEEEGRQEAVVVGHSSAHHSQVAAGRPPGSASFAPSVALGEAEVCGVFSFFSLFCVFYSLRPSKA